MGKKLFFLWATLIALSYISQDGDLVSAENFTNQTTFQTNFTDQKLHESLRNHNKKLAYEEMMPSLDIHEKELDKVGVLPVHLDNKELSFKLKGSRPMNSNGYDHANNDRDYITKAIEEYMNEIFYIYGSRMRVKMRKLKKIVVQLSRIDKLLFKHERICKKDGVKIEVCPNKISCIPFENYHPFIYKYPRGYGRGGIEVQADKQHRDKKTLKNFRCIIDDFKENRKCEASCKDAPNCYKGGNNCDKKCQCDKKWVNIYNFIMENKFRNLKFLEKACETNYSQVLIYEKFLYHIKEYLIPYIEVLIPDFNWDEITIYYGGIMDILQDVEGIYLDCKFLAHTINYNLYLIKVKKLRYEKDIEKIQLSRAYKGKRCTNNRNPTGVCGKVREIYLKTK